MKMAMILATSPVGHITYDLFRLSVPLNALASALGPEEDRKRDCDFYHHSAC